MKLLPLLLLLGATPSPPPDASPTTRGLVNTKPQAFSGLKTFDGGLWAWTINDVVPGPTTAELSLYLDVNGNDANPCSSSAPCKTVSGVFRRVPKTLRHVVRIFADAGTYGPDSALVEGLALQEAGGLFFYGTPIRVAVDGGSATGTLTAVANTLPFPSLTDTSQSWVTDSLRGAQVRITSGAAAGNTGLVHRNTATQLLLVGTITGTVAVGNTFEILTPGTILTSNNGLSDSLNPQALTFRNITSRPTAAPISGGFDGGAYGAVSFQWVTVRQLGTSNFGVVLYDVGGRVALADSVVEAAISVAGRNEQLQLARTIARARTSSTALSVGSLAELRGLIGPYLFDCLGTTATCVSVRSSTLGIANTTGNVIEIPSTGVSAVFATGGTIRATSSVTNGGWRISCSSGTGTGVQLEGASTALNASPNELTNNFMLVESCATGLRVSGPSEVALFSSTFADAGTAIFVERGAHVRLNNAPTLNLVTTEITVDGTSFTTATLNAASPQVVPTTFNPYGSWVSR